MGIFNNRLVKKLTIYSSSLLRFQRGTVANQLTPFLLADLQQSHEDELLEMLHELGEVRKELYKERHVEG